jgi:alpha-D-xyloside xylohydrolase
MHIDCYWQRFGRWSDLMWDDSAFRQPEQLLDDLHADGWHVSLWINPYIGTSSPVFDEAAASKYFLAHPAGGPYVCKTWAGDHHPVTGILDFTNPDVRGWYAEKLRALLRQGVDVFKTDFGEGVPADAVAHDGSTGRSLHNPYPLLYNDVVSDVTAEVRGHRLVWGRSTWSGGQRHAAQWGGDPNSSWADMAATLRGGLSFAMSGHAFWSHDIGGFHGKPDPELYVRWAQFGLLSPLSRMHGMSSRLPWEFGDEALSVVRDFARLRYSLLPYIYSASMTSVQTGSPVMRPLLVDYAEDPACWTADLEYLLGPDLLVAPIFAPGGERDVYLPHGRWVDFYSGEASEGGRWIHVHTPLDRCPLWVREGTVLPRTRVQGPIVDEPWDALDLEGYLPPGDVGSAATEMLDVDGRTTRVGVDYERERLSLTVSGVRNGDRFVFRNANGRRPRVQVNGHPVPAEQTMLDERGDLIVVLGAVELGQAPPRSGTPA